MTDRLRVEHIPDAISEIENYLLNVSYELFLDNSEKRFATIKQLEIIGEACSNITSETKLSNSEIEWNSIKAFRNISIHEYFGVNFHCVWEIVKNDLPTLKEKFNAILVNLK